MFLFDKGHAVYMTAFDIIDYDRYLATQIRYYQDCQLTGCKVTEKQYMAYLKMRSQLIDIMGRQDFGA